MTPKHSYTFENQEHQFSDFSGLAAWRGVVRTKEQGSLYKPFPRQLVPIFARNCTEHGRARTVSFEGTFLRLKRFVQTTSGPTRRAQ